MPRLALASSILLAAALPAAAFASAPKELFDAPGQAHATVCASLASSPKPLRYGDAASTGFEVTDQFSFTADAPCADGTVRLDLHELIPSPQGPLAFHRGGKGYRNDGNVKYGEIATADFAGALPAPVPASGGRGAACDLAAGPAYTVSVKSMPEAMHYKRPRDLPSGSNKGASFEHYGDPAADQGSRHDLHYTYLLWSFMDVRGGGTVRTLLAPGQIVRPCDVEPATMSSWDSAGRVNGQVSARYVRVLAGSCPLYGWMVWEHTYLDGSPGEVAHAAAAEAPPPPDPVPDPGCPVAAPASPPLAATGDASGAGDGAVTLAGTVNPIGVPGSYRFEYGLGPDYGSGTPDAAFTSADRDVPVAATVGGLEPAATYHYRLVATTTHGTTYGDDRTLTVAPLPLPPAPQPAALITAAPVVRPASVTWLRVTPGRFRRARSSGGLTASIRYGLSQRANVTIRFERRAGRRWVGVRGSLRRSSAAGGSRMRFGGWLGHRRLALGRYRLAMVATGVAGGAGKARHARFTLRAR